jgi:hypothetical protein
MINNNSNNNNNESNETKDTINDDALLKLFSLLMKLKNFNYDKDLN